MRFPAAIGHTPDAHTPFPADRHLQDVRYQWNLSDLYPDDGAWRAAKRSLVAEIPSITRFSGRLGESAATLHACFALIARLSKEFLRLSTYAQLGSDADTRVADRLAMAQEMSQIGADLGVAASFVDPELLALGRKVIEPFLSADPQLAEFRHSIDNVLRRQEHTGTTGEEKILADAALIADAPDSVFNVFTNADFPYPSITLADGNTVRLDKAGFSLHRQSRHRPDREKIFAAYFTALAGYQRTFGAQLYGAVKRDLFYARARKYASCLAAALDGNNVPVDVYTALIRNVRENLPTFHRYLRLRATMLGVDQLRYHDLYAPAVADVDLTYTFEEARDLVLRSLAPLGEAYVAVAGRAFAERWFDVYPATGKTSGAYSNGSAYDVHPYMLLNFNGKYDDVSTLTHELGHTMHSFLANSAQPFSTSQYAIFVAEVASTFNEALLMEHMLRVEQDDAVRLSLLMHYLDEIRGTLYRQTQFAEFELRMHEMAERGETLTGESLSALYGSLTREYYGHDAGVCLVDEGVQHEWMNVPHFYYTFYVFQYATSLTASAALSEQVLSGGPNDRERYLSLLAAGGADYPVTLLRTAGVDMTTPEPFRRMMGKMHRLMDEIERILAARDR
jgi:oligoendopeptidase F